MNSNTDMISEEKINIDLVMLNEHIEIINDKLLEAYNNEDYKNISTLSVDLSCLKSKKETLQYVLGKRENLIYKPFPEVKLDNTYISYSFFSVFKEMIFRKK